MHKPWRALLIFGTRPEAIKLAPLFHTLQQNPRWEPIVCITAQHREMLDQVLHFFNLPVHIDLHVMQPNQSLFHTTTTILARLEKIFQTYQPDITIVQGDTTTTFTGALASFYCQIPVAHVEAGLRTHNRYAPFPEEINRRLTAALATVHFPPTCTALRNLYAENIRKHVYVVGNTGIDALLYARQLIRASHWQKKLARQFAFLNNQPLILITGHRRESFGEGLRQICLAIRDLAKLYPHIHFLYPVHKNPNVQQPVYAMLGNLNNVHLLPPVDYPTMVWLMERAHLILTDSGGIQEEAPTLGKPVLVMREVTERPEGIHAGTAQLVGTRRESIVTAVRHLLENPQRYQQMARARNPYGDGFASRRIVGILTRLMESRALNHH